jgi:hypothetical protein
MNENKSLIRFLGKLYKSLEVENQIKELRAENPGLEEAFPDLGERALAVKGGTVFWVQYEICQALNACYQCLQKRDETVAMMNDPSRQISDPEVRKGFENQIRNLDGIMNTVEDHLVTKLAEAVQKGIIQMKRDDSQENREGKGE